ncbi:dihydroorotase [Patescibacteria group bacterium]|nr:dihydroorotase [Patescibacteria group bacterium]
MSKIIIKNGRVVDPSQGLDEVLDVIIEKNKIKALKKNVSEEESEIIDAKGKIVTPGLIDMHVHLREPGREDKETIKTCSEAAAAGGFTTIFGMPNTSPVADNQTVIEYVNSKARKEAVVNIYSVANITKKGQGQEMSEIADLKKAGAIALSDDGVDVPNSGVLRHAFEYASELGMPVFSHSEDPDLAGTEWAMNEGYMSTKLGLPGKPKEAEEVAIARNIEIARLAGVKLHITHINTETSALLVSQGREKGLEVTCDTCPQFFTLDETLLENYDPKLKMNPPIREKAELEAIKRRLADGTIDAITSDHAPHLLVEKDLEFENCENGIVGLETSLGLVLTFLVHKGIIDYQRMVQLMSHNPAQISGLQNKGTLAPGADADITVIDPEKEWTVNKNAFKSKGRNTPFHGWKLKGRAEKIMIEGHFINLNI